MVSRRPGGLNRWGVTIEHVAMKERSVSHSGAQPTGHEPRSRRRWPAWRDHLLFWPVTASVFYIVVNLAVMGLEYRSEMSKLSRGFFSDTFTPYAFTHLLTFPTSALWPDWHGYPEVFDETPWKDTVRDAVGPALRNVAIQAVLVAAVVLYFATRPRRSQK
jgi:hypothetical protein